MAINSATAYLDNAATTAMVPEAVLAMSQQLGIVGNASSLHAAGRSARKVVEESREAIADAVGASPSEVIFTGSGTEANNAAIKGLFWAAPDKNLIVVSAIEHHAVLDPAHWLVEHEGAELIEVPVTSDGVIDCDFLAPSAVGEMLRLRLRVQKIGTSSLTLAIEARAGVTYHLQVDGKATGSTPPSNAPFTLTLNDSIWQGLAGSSVTCAPVIPRCRAAHASARYIAPESIYL